MTEKYWEWEGHTIRYQESGTEGPAMILVHGFGGNAVGGAVQVVNPVDS